jgi:hypothetical protein
MTDRDELSTPRPDDAPDRADIPHTETSMTDHPDPTADPTADLAADPTAEPDPTPFRVEPATPVPDDATSNDLGDLSDPDATVRLAQLPPPSAWAPSPAPAPPAERGYARVTVRKGPRPGAVVLGLLAMLVSAYVIVVNVSDANLELRLVGPALIGALGGLLLLVGLAGVVLGRLRR